MGPDLVDVLPQLEDFVEHHIGGGPIRDTLLDIIDKAWDMVRKSTMPIPFAGHWYDAAHTLRVHATRIDDHHQRLRSAHAPFVGTQYVGASARAFDETVSYSLTSLQHLGEKMGTTAALANEIGGHFERAQIAQVALAAACLEFAGSLAVFFLTAGASIEVNIPVWIQITAQGTISVTTIAVEISAADLAIAGLATLAFATVMDPQTVTDVPKEIGQQLRKVPPPSKWLILILIGLGLLGAEVEHLLNPGQTPNNAPMPNPDPIPEDQGARTRRRDQTCGGAKDHARWAAVFGASEPAIELEMTAKHPIYWCYIMNELADIIQDDPLLLAGGVSRLMDNLFQKGEATPIDLSKFPNNSFVGAFFEMQWIHDHESRVVSIEPIWNKSDSPDGKDGQGQRGADAELQDGTVVELKSSSSLDHDDLLRQIEKDKRMYPGRPIHFVFDANKLGNTPPSIPPRLFDLFAPGQQPPVTYEIYRPTEEVTSQGVVLPSYP